MSVPAFDGYYPTEETMDPPQRRFYTDLEARLRRGECPDVEGQVSYVFTYLYKLIASVKQRGFSSLHDYLIRLAEAYTHEPKVAGACRAWAYDCLLGQKQYELYLEKTEPVTPLGLAVHASNLRLNVQEHCGLEANAIDILRLFAGRSSKFIKDNLGLYRDCIRAIFEQAAEKEGAWFQILAQQIENPERRYPHNLFQGAVIPWGIAQLEFGLRGFYASSTLETRVKELAKAAENKAREIKGVPNVGEGWISETTLFRTLQEHFRQTVTIQHGQPGWLGRQHFDVWFPDWNIAVEFHGEQHFHPVAFFGGDEAFARGLERDARKAALARCHGVMLLVVTNDDEVASLIAKIKRALDERGPALPPT